jgi:hypothetical protein
VIVFGAVIPVRRLALDRQWGSISAGSRSIHSPLPLGQ